MPCFDRFDVVTAHAVYWSHNHGGQYPDGYARLCRALRLLNGQLPNSLSENAQAIYDRLERQDRAHA